MAIYFHDFDMCTTELDILLRYTFSELYLSCENRENKSLTKITWFTVLKRLRNNQFELKVPPMSFTPMLLKLPRIPLLCVKLEFQGVYIIFLTYIDMSSHYHSNICLFEVLRLGRQFFCHFGTTSWVQPVLSIGDEVSC